MTTDIRHDVVRLNDVSWNTDADATSPGAPIPDATSLGLSRDERESIIGQLATTPEAKAALRTKSDIYLKTRLEIAAELGTVSKTNAPTIEIRVSEGAALRNDAAVAEAAYRKSVAGMNDWRNEPNEPATRGDAAAPAPAPVPVSTGNARLDAEAAYKRSVDGLNAWRNAR